MPKVKYTGQANYREISAADFKSLGVEDQQGVKWDRDDRRDRPGWKQVVELSDAALAALNEKDTAGGYNSYEVVEEPAPESVADNEDDNTDAEDTEADAAPAITDPGIAETPPPPDVESPGATTVRRRR